MYQQLVVRFFNKNINNRSSFKSISSNNYPIDLSVLPGSPLPFVHRPYFALKPLPCLALMSVACVSLSLSILTKLHE